MIKSAAARCLKTGRAEATRMLLTSDSTMFVSYAAVVIGCSLKAKGRESYRR